jgi:hypothetical protein
VEPTKYQIWKYRRRIFYILTHTLNGQKLGYYGGDLLPEVETKLLALYWATKASNDEATTAAFCRASASIIAGDNYEMGIALSLLTFFVSNKIKFNVLDDAVRRLHTRAEGRLTTAQDDLRKVTLAANFYRGIAMTEEVQSPTI